VTLYGQNSTSASIGLIQAQAGSTIDFTGNNNVLGTILQGNVLVQNGTTNFTGTTNQGVLTAGDGGTINFFNGTMSQLAGGGVPGFSQTTGALNILDLTATAGTFSGNWVCA
jgi:hypothetical protein